MKTKLTLLALSLIFLSCEKDLCNEGYTEVNDVCIPDYVVGITNKTIEEGQLYFHLEFGIIQYNNGQWYTDNNKIVGIKK